MSTPHSVAFNGLYCGNTLYIPSCFDAKAIVALIKKYKIEYVQMVPTLMQRIIRLPDFNPEDLLKLRSILSHHGGVCSRRLKTEWFDILPQKRSIKDLLYDRMCQYDIYPGDEWLAHG